jgi:2',3'-cyclic-nucleotide 2'-phosphodiesterase (5'-nucleotidase family)
VSVNPTYIDKRGQIQKVDVERATRYHTNSYLAPTGNKASTSNTQEVESLKDKIKELEELVSRLRESSGGSFKNITLEEIIALQKDDPEIGEDKRELFKSILKDNLKLKKE